MQFVSYIVIEKRKEDMGAVIPFVTNEELATAQPIIEEIERLAEVSEEEARRIYTRQRDFYISCRQVSPEPMLVAEWMIYADREDDR